MSPLTDEVLRLRRVHVQLCAYLIQLEAAILAARARLSATDQGRIQTPIAAMSELLLDKPAVAKPPAAEVRRPRFLTDEECRKLAQAAPGCSPALQRRVARRIGPTHLVLAQPPENDPEAA